ncbi:MAG: hypothetical protein P8X96_21760 [Desulfobacteraceae bacterium]
MKVKRRLESVGMKRLVSLLIMGLSIAVVISCGGGSGGGGGGSNGSVSGSGTGSGLELNTYSVSFTANLNGALPSNQSVTVSVTDPDAYYLIAGYPPSVTAPTWLDMSISGSSSPFALILSINSSSIPVGTHQTTVRVLCARSDNSVIAYRDISVAYTVTDELTVVPQTLNFSYTNGASSVPADQSLSIGGQGFTWTASANQSWVNLSAASGTSPSTLIVGVDPTGLATGIHSALLTVSDGTTDLTVDVTLTIGAPSISVSPSAIVLGDTNGLDMSAQSFQFSLSTGSNVYPWSATLTTGSGGPWLLTGASSGTVSSSPVSIIVDADRSGLSAGSYAGNIQINAVVGSDVVSIDVPVTLNTSAHRLFVSDNGVAFSSMPTLSRLTHTVAVQDTYGMTTTHWNAVSNQSWLSVTNSGTTSGNLMLSADPTGLSSDTVHYATVTISSPDAGIENTETVRVGLWVGSSDPAAVFSDTVAYSEIVADAIRPYAYAHDNGTDIDIYNVFTGVVVATIPSVAAQLGPMTKSSDGSFLYALDLTNQQIVAINLDTLAVGSGWNLGPVMTTARIAYARPKGFGVLLTSNGWAYDATNGTRQTENGFLANGNVAANLDSNMMVVQRIGTSGHSFYRYTLDYSTLGPQRLFITLTHAYSESGFARDLAISDDGLQVYSACGSPYNFRVYDGDTLALDQSLPAGAYPNNVEVGTNGLFYGGISALYGPTDIWVYDSGGAVQSSYYASGYADNIVDRQLAVSADGLSIIVLTTDPTIQFITGP